MTTENLSQRIKAHAERSDVVGKLTALLAVWEEAIDGATDDPIAACARIRDAGDAYVEALAVFIDSRAKRAVLGVKVAE